MVHCNVGMVPRADGQLIEHAGLPSLLLRDMNTGTSILGIVIKFFIRTGGMEINTS